MKRKKTLRNILIGATAGTAVTVYSLFGMNSVMAQNVPERLPDMAPRTEVVDSFNENNDQDIKINEDGNSEGITVLPDDPQHPMYGLNLYIPAWDEYYQTNKDWYGSGDINGDGFIDMTDYNSTITGSDPFNDGTYRGDTDLDGDSGDADDKAIILDYINGNITHINKWELESESEKQSHLVKALAIDPTSEINAGSSGWTCSPYRSQLFINFNGTYDVYNSSYANNNGTNLQFDLTHNGIFRIPLRNVDTKTSTNVSHTINVAYLGDPSNQNATEFGDRIYVEPQTDIFQNPGDYSLNDFANEEWYGYYYNNLFQQWQYGNVPIISYDLDATPIIGSNISPNLVTSWTPFDNVTYPDDQIHEFPADVSVAANGEPSDLYEGTVYSHSDVSTQTNNGTCSDVNYTVTRSWEGVAGAYNSGNTLVAADDQIIEVEDTSPPTADFPTGITLEYYVGIENTLNSNLFAAPTNIQDNSNLPVSSVMNENSTQVMNGTCSQVNFIYSHDWELSDVCSNNLNHNIMANVIDTSPPTYTIGPNGPENVEDNSGLEVIVTSDTNSTQGSNPNNCNYYNYSQIVTHRMTDVCGNEASYDDPAEQIVNEAPYIVSTPVPNNDTIYVPEGQSIHPDYTGWAEWVDPENGPITEDYNDELIEESTIHRLWYRTQSAEDPCEMSPDSAYHYVYEHKPTGVEEIAKKEVNNAYVFPNPNNGDFKVHYNNGGDVKIGLYNPQGQLLEEKVYQNLPEGTNLPYHMKNKAKGLYIMKIQSDDGIETEKIINQ